MSDERVLAGYTGVQTLRSEEVVRSYRATGPAGADVCLKVVDTDAESAKAAVRDLETARLLQHPNLATVTDKASPTLATTSFANGSRARIWERTHDSRPSTSLPRWPKAWQAWRPFTALGSCAETYDPATS